MRSIYLTTVFPRLIARGRAWLTPKLLSDDRERSATGASTDSVCSDESCEDPPQERARDSRLATFDIHFLRFSILADALMTASVALVSHEWQLFVLVAILPLAGGSAPASKGVITELVGAAHKQEALSAMALVESFATVSSATLFGTLNAALTKKGLPQMVFLGNGVS